MLQEEYSPDEHSRQGIDTHSLTKLTWKLHELVLDASTEDEA
jgi:hypothetical protein